MWRRQRQEPTDVVEQATFFPGRGRRSRQADTVSAPLHDRETVARWLRETAGSPGALVFVDRQWGTRIPL